MRVAARRIAFIADPFQKDPFYIFLKACKAFLQPLDGRICRLLFTAVFCVIRCCLSYAKRIHIDNDSYLEE